MAFKEGGMASGLLIIAVSIVFADGLGFLELHFVPGTPFWINNQKLQRLGIIDYTSTVSRFWIGLSSSVLFLTL